MEPVQDNRSPLDSSMGRNDTAPSAVGRYVSPAMTLRALYARCADAPSICIEPFASSTPIPSPRSLAERRAASQEAHVETQKAASSVAHAASPPLRQRPISAAPRYHPSPPTTVLYNKVNNNGLQASSLRMAMGSKSLLDLIHTSSGHSSEHDVESVGGASVLSDACPYALRRTARSGERIAAPPRRRPDNLQPPTPPAPSALVDKEGGSRAAATTTTSIAAAPPSTTTPTAADVANDEHRNHQQPPTPCMQDHAVHQHGSVDDATPAGLSDPGRLSPHAAGGPLGATSFEVEYTMSRPNGVGSSFQRRGSSSMDTSFSTSGVQIRLEGPLDDSMPLAAADRQQHRRPQPQQQPTAVPSLVNAKPQPNHLFNSWIPMGPDDTNPRAPPATVRTRIEEFLETVDEGRSPEVTVSYHCGDAMSNSTETNMCASGLSKPPTEGEDSHIGGTDALRSSNSVAFTAERLWLLFLVYIRLHRFVARWRASHRKGNEGPSKPRDPVRDLVDTLDSTSWLHIYSVEWRERRAPSKMESQAGPTASLSATATSSGPMWSVVSGGMMTSNNSAAESNFFRAMTSMRGFEKATLHVSTSHLYVASVQTTNSWTIRFGDLVQLTPRRGGFDIVFTSDDAEGDGSESDDGRSVTPQGNGLSCPSPALSAPSPTFLADETGYGIRATASGYFQYTNHDNSVATASSSPLHTEVSKKALAGHAHHSDGFSVSGERLRNVKRVAIRCKDSNSVMHCILEQQSRYLRGFSMTLADRLVLRNETKTLHIVHFNDVYHLPSFKPASARGVVGGAARFHTVLAKLRETTNPLVLFSGDFMGPSLMSVITKGKQMVDALNFLGVHYGCFGNHEFDYGLRVLKEVIHGYTQGKHIYTGSQTTWVMSNMTESDGTPLGGAKPYSVLVWNGVRVGLLGLCENWLPQCANLHATEATYVDMFECGERMACYLKETEGVELVFALTHNRNVNDRELAVRCPSIDYIFGGHDHKFKSEPKYRFLKSGQEFEYLSTVEVILAPQKKPKYRIDCTPITYDIKESEYLRGLITRYDAKMAEKLGRVIGKTDVPLDSTEETVRFKEGCLTNFILDVIQSSMNTDLAFLGAAAISGKEVKPAGNVTLGDVFGWFPNDTKIMTMYLKGSTIQKTLDVMVRELPAEAPSFPHPSQQLRFTINTMHKPTPVCEAVLVNGAPLELDKEYLCAVEDFVGIGKAKYKHVAQEGRVVLGEDDAVQVVTMVRDFFLKKKVSDVDAKDAAALKNVTKIVSSATHIGVDMDMAKSQRFIRSLICELMHCDRSSIFLVDHATEEIHFVPDGAVAAIRMPKSKGLAGHCATSCEVLNIEDCYEDARFNRDVDKRFGYRTKTMLCCPVLLDGRTCSAVVQAINKDNDAVFDEIDEITLRVLGEQVSFQLRYQAIFQEASAELQFMMGWVLDIFRSISSEVCLDLLTVFKTIASHASGCFRCDNIVTYRYDEVTNEVCYMEEGLDDESILVSAEVHPSSLVADLIKTLTPRMIKDASKLMILRPNDSLSLRNVMAMPLVSCTGNCIGILLVCDKPRGFVADDDTVARYFGRLAAVAMENAIRLSRILAASSETTLPTVPILPVDRIHLKGGWATLKRAYRIAKSQRQLAVKAGNPPPPMRGFFRGTEASCAEITLEGSMGASALSSTEVGTTGTGRRQPTGKLASLWGSAIRRASTVCRAPSGAFGANQLSDKTPTGFNLEMRKRSSLNLQISSSGQGSPQRTPRVGQVSVKSPEEEPVSPLSGHSQIEPAVLGE